KPARAASTTARTYFTAMQRGAFSGTLSGREIGVERATVGDGVERSREGWRRRRRRPGVPAAREQMPREQPGLDPAQGDRQGGERGRGRLVVRYQVSWPGSVAGSAVATIRRTRRSGP